MTPHTVVKHFDVLEHTRSRLRSILIVLIVDQLLLQRGEKTFHRRVLPAVASPAHATGVVVPLQQPLVVVTGVLAATIRVRQQTFTRQATCYRHLQGIHPQTTGNSLTHRPTDALSRVQIFHGCQVQPTLSRRDIRDVRHPGLIRCARLKLPIQDILRHRSVMVGVGGTAELPFAFGCNPLLTHEFSHRVLAAILAPCPQFPVHTRTAVAFFDLLMDGLDFDDQRLTPSLAYTGGTPSPGVVAAGGNLQQPTHQSHRPVGAVFVDEAVFHSDSLAKKAVAFFKMSRSIWSRLFSARRRRSSSSRVGRLPLPGKAWLPSASKAFFHLRSRLSAMPRSRAASAKLRPCSVTSLTASILNSRVKIRRGSLIKDLLTKSLHSFLSAHHPWGSPLIETYLQEPPPQNIIGIEHEIIAPIHNSRGEYLERPLLSVADLITESNEELTVQEFKTSGRAYSEMEAETSLQPTCYVNAAQEAFGQPAIVEYTVLVKT